MFRRPPSAPPFIPSYELLRIVGRGAYGEVWLARSLTGHYCAIKIVWRDRFQHPQPYEHEFNGLKSFTQLPARERRQLALLHVGRQDAAGFFYYVMELADDADARDGPSSWSYQPLTLKRWCRQHASLPLRELLEHVIDVTQALANLHAAGLVHRDIKPSNLLMIVGHATLADIGSLAEGPGGSNSIGTDGFIPPEGAGSTQADVYSLGKVLYELVTQRDRRDFPRLPDNLSQHPERRELLEFNEILVRACDPAPDRRHRDGSVLLKELRLLRSGQSIRKLRQSEAFARRARTAKTLMVLVSVFGLGEAVRVTGQLHPETFTRRLTQQRRNPSPGEDTRVSLSAPSARRSADARISLKRPGPAATASSEVMPADRLGGGDGTRHP